MSQQQTFTTDATMPSDTLTTFKLDLSDATIVAGDIPASGGSDSPVSHIERIAGDNGIKTIQLPNVPGTFALRFIRGENITVGATTQTLITQAIPINSSMTINVIVAGIADDNNCCGGYTVATVKNIAGVASIVDQGDLILNSEATLIGSTFQLSVSGANFLVAATGVALRTINWTACLPGVVVGG